MECEVKRNTSGPKEDFKVGDYIIYNDRETYVGTIQSINSKEETAEIKVPLNYKGNLVMEKMVVSISKLKKRALV